MTPESVMGLGREGLLLGLIVSLPILAVALFVGLSVSVFQAVTQIQEMTLTYVPKVIGAVLVFILMGSWMLTTLVKFMLFCLQQAAQVQV
jgi:flagellar biosynthetic protein FliQ